jgi:hypothetical protein
MLKSSRDIFDSLLLLNQETPVIFAHPCLACVKTFGPKLRTVIRFILYGKNKVWSVRAPNVSYQRLYYNPINFI